MAGSPLQRDAGKRLIGRIVVVCRSGDETLTRAPSWMPQGSFPSHSAYGEVTGDMVVGFAFMTN
jgi:hypothetical protein